VLREHVKFDNQQTKAFKSISIRQTFGKIFFRRALHILQVKRILTMEWRESIFQ